MRFGVALRPKTRRSRGETASPLRRSLRRFRRNKIAVCSVVFLFLVVVMAVFADNTVLIFIPNLFGANLHIRPLLAPKAFDEVNFRDNNMNPGAKYPLGADYLGRDILSRTIFGARISLAVAFLASAVSMCIGLVYGLVSGYAGTRTDNVMMRIVDYLYAFPVLMIVMLLQVYFSALDRAGATGFVAGVLNVNRAMGGLFLLFIVIGALNWLQMARIARGQVLALKAREFIEAARSIGVPRSGMLFRHLLPNILGPCIVAETLQLPRYILYEAFLSFLGLGVQPPMPSWGIMVAENYQALRGHPALVLAPCVVLSLTTLAFNFLGDGLRDAFDPQL